MNAQSKGLGKWLNKEGITKDNSSTPQSQKNPTGEKPAPKKHTSPRSPKKQQGGRPPHKGGGGQRRFSDHNPDAGRRTAKTRHTHHPINRHLGGKHQGDVRIVPMGGLDAVGQNMTFIEHNDEIIVIDTGVLFATYEEPGIDGVVPDVEYLRKNKHKIKGVIYTHGHLDHIGGMQYILPELDFPMIYTSRLTRAMIEENAKEYGFGHKLKFKNVIPKDKIKMGKMEVEFFHINHSIPESLGVVVWTPYGGVVVTMDFKFDYNPLDGHMTDFNHLAQIAHRGVALHLCDSTNAAIPGFARSEIEIVEPMRRLLKHHDGRLILTVFGSNMSRASKIVEWAEELGRTVYISGRSLEKNLAHARKYNYLKCKDKSLKRLARGVKLGNPKKTLIMCTGGQGEQYAALTRMARGEHKQVKLVPEDTIVFSTSKIPGNELPIGKLYNNLVDKGVKIIEAKDESLHASGHGNQEDIKLMVNVLNPKHFVPIHGEVHMRHMNKKMIMKALGFPEEFIVNMDHGRGIVLNQKGARLMTQKEMIPTKRVYMEGGIKLPQAALEDRLGIAERGIIFAIVQQSKGKVQKIHLRTRGFRFLPKDKPMQELQKKLKESFERSYSESAKRENLENMLQKVARDYFMQEHNKIEPVIDVIIQ